MIQVSLPKNVLKWVDDNRKDVSRAAYIVRVLTKNIDGEKNNGSEKEREGILPSLRRN